MLAHASSQHERWSDRPRSCSYTGLLGSPETSRAALTLVFSDRQKPHELLLHWSSRIARNLTSYSYTGLLGSPETSRATPTSVFSDHQKPHELLLHWSSRIARNPTRLLHRSSLSNPAAA
ncbi:hypothetical protein E2P81_ATG08063 [Venturia nashicola]|nr:hypothetical protein E2P81_ATG08063 [Venturia nashicola]